MIIGYTCGVYDLFHVGHLNLLRNAKLMCDRLIVGVSSDELASYKGKRPFIPYFERIEIIRSIRYADLAIPQTNLDKFEAWKKLKFDILFVGDDWYESSKWREYERRLKEVNVTTIYFPYTTTTSSTLIKNKIVTQLDLQAVQ
jgi:glycerol-3-phosphate cytidylyltransferase